MFTYDKLYLTKVTDLKGQVFEFGYNAVGWGTWTEDPTNKRDSLYYSLDGEVVRRRNREGQYIYFAYDALHRLVKKWGSGATTDTIRYNTGSGVNWVREHNANATQYTYYDNDGFVDSVSVFLGGNTFRFKYNYT